VETEGIVDCMVGCAWRLCCPPTDLWLLDWETGIQPRGLLVDGVDEERVASLFVDVDELHAGVGEAESEAGVFVIDDRRGDYRRRARASVDCWISDHISPSHPAVAVVRYDERFPVAVLLNTGDQVAVEPLPGDVPPE